MEKNIRNRSFKISDILNRNSFPLRILISAVIVLAAIYLLFAANGYNSYAAEDLDNILKYEITVNVNQDATLDLVYHIDWMVLDSDSEGPLSWVKIGIPNKHYISYRALSDTISDIDYRSANGPSLRIDFDRSYYAGEVVSFDFELVQDYMYEVDKLTDGETVYVFTPGWFDDIYVDDLKIKWNSDKMESWSPSCEIEDGYNVWETYLAKGDKFQVQVVYANDAYDFDESKTIAPYKETGSSGSSTNSGSSNGSGGIKSIAGVFSVLFGSIASLMASMFSASPVAMAIIALCIIRRKFRNRYNSSANFGSSPKITRTKIEYYPNCPGCNAPRPEGRDNCQYCGCSFIKSETKVEEKDIPPEEKDILNKKENGTYRYSSSPNTYMRVHVIPVPVVRSSSGSSRSSGSSSGSSRGSSSSRSSHSSCAHSSCACACACACAGGGRAGCTTKDFYNTDLKLKYFERKKNRK